LNKSVPPRLALESARLVKHVVQVGDAAIALEKLDEGVLVYRWREIADI
jgi:hypothetical protein